MSEQVNPNTPKSPVARPTPQDVKRRLSVLVAPQPDLTSSTSASPHSPSFAQAPHSPALIPPSPRQQPVGSSSSGAAAESGLNMSNSRSQGYSSAVSSSGMSSTSEDESGGRDDPVSPRANTSGGGVPNAAHLSAITEATDDPNYMSGTDSDASSEAGAGGTSRRRRGLGVGNDQEGGAAASSSSHHSNVTKALERLRISRESTRLSESVALKSGYLMKKGERRKAWKKRWFVLRGGQLAMYKNEKEYRLLRLIPLSEIHTCSPIELKKHSHGFGIVTPKRTYYIKADSDKEVRDWCQAVERAKRDLASSTTVTSFSDVPTPGDLTPHASGARSPEAPRPLGVARVPTSGLAQDSGSNNNNAISSPELQPMNTFASSPSPAMTNDASLMSTSYASTTSSMMYPPSSSSSYQGGQTGLGIPGAPVPRGGNGAMAPPNSYVPGAGGALGLQGADGHSLELNAVDVGIEKASSSRQRQRSVQSLGGISSRSGSLGPQDPSTLTVPGSRTSSSGFGPANDYFGSSTNRSGGAAAASSSFNPPLSPGGGGVSSSEDEDGFDTIEPSWPTASAVAAAQAGGVPPSPGSNRPIKQLAFADQQQFTPRAAGLAPSPAIPATPGGVNSGGFADPNKVILSGYLMKQGKRKTWRKRWFVLMSTRLMYSRSHMDAKIHRQIPLARILDAIEHDGPIPGQQSSNNSSNPSNSSSMKRGSFSTPQTPLSPNSMPNTLGGDKSVFDHCFKIITPKRTFLVCAPSEEDEIKWLAALQCLVQRKNAGSGAVVGGAPTTPNLTNQLYQLQQQAQPAQSQVPPHQQQQQQQVGGGGARSTLAPSYPPPSNSSGRTFSPGPQQVTRTRSGTDAARAAVDEVERRFHPNPGAAQAA